MLRAIADKAVRTGKTPLDIMLRNMRFYDEKAEAMLGVIESKLGDQKSVPAELLELLREMSTYRMSAQKCAVDAAPFVHPKLSAIEYKNTTDKIAGKPEDQMSREELADYWRQLRDRPLTTSPLIIDNETGDPVHAEEDEDA